MSAQHLIQQLASDVERFDFFAALRILESHYADKPRLGTSLKAVDDPVRLHQIPELEFLASSLARFEEDEPARLAVNFMGLFGPHGALPLHLTEYARERQRHHHDSTFVRFADIFHQRMISLFYRAWANARPAPHYDRPLEDRFATYVGSFLGIGAPAFLERDALADNAKLHYAAHFSAQTKHPDGLCSIIHDILQIPIHLDEFIGEWMPIEQREQSRLGQNPALSTLGQSALIGAQVWSCQHKFRLVLGAMNLSQYLSLLPGGRFLPQLVAMVRNYIGDEFVWDIQLILDNTQVPPEISLKPTSEQSEISLNGAAQLGWTMWLGPRQTQQPAADLILNPYVQQV